MAESDSTSDGTREDFGSEADESNVKDIPEVISIVTNFASGLDEMDRKDILSQARSVLDEASGSMKAAHAEILRQTELFRDAREATSTLKQKLSDCAAFKIPKGTGFGFSLGIDKEASAERRKQDAELKELYAQLAQFNSLAAEAELAATEAAALVGEIANEIGDLQNLEEAEAAPPEAPGRPYTTDVDGDHMTLEWSSPASDCGSDITHYIIEMKTSNKDEWTKAFDDDDITAEQCTVEGLVKGMTYEFRVAAANEKGIGVFSEASEPTVAKPPYELPEVPGRPEIEEVDSDEMVITWTKPSSDGGASIDRYIIEMQTEVSTDWVKASECTSITTKIGDLKESEGYKFRVAAFNKAGQGPFSEASESTLAKRHYDVPGVPGTPAIKDVDSTFIIIAWSAPASDGGKPIKSYTIQKRENSSDWRHETSDWSGSMTCKIEGLVKGHKYEFRVNASNKAGPSAFSKPSKPTMTKPRYDIPSIPGRPEVTVIGINNMIITWKKAKSHPDVPVLRYIVEKKLATSETWENFSKDGVKASTDKEEKQTLQVEDLQEHEEYVFRVSATNKIGQSEFGEASLPRRAKSCDGIPFVMISYQWDSQERMMQLNENLTKAGFSVWLDIEEMEGNMDDCMANAVEKSAAVIVCLSRKYRDSANCKKEAQYASQQKKYILPVKYEKNFIPSGWLGLLVNSLLYHLVDTEKSLDKSLPKIIKSLEKHGVPRRSIDGKDASIPKKKGQMHPSEWPYETIYFKQDIDEDETEKEIGCFLRYNKDSFESYTSPVFECISLINDYELSTTAADIETEELVSDVIALRRVDVDVEDLGTSIIVAIPYNSRLAARKEPIIKFASKKRLDDPSKRVSWKTVRWYNVLSNDGNNYKEIKPPVVCAEFNISCVGIFAVVVRRGRDRLRVDERGGVLKSSVDQRVTMAFPPRAETRTVTVAVQVQPAEPVATDIKSRFQHCQPLIAASPIIYVTHSVDTRYSKPVTVTIPVPANPFVESPRESSSRPVSAREASSLPEGAPAPIRRTKSRLFGGDPTEDALHFMYRNAETNAWMEAKNVEMKQSRKDVVEVDLKAPLERIAILRTTAESHYPIPTLMQTYEMAHDIRYTQIIFQQKVDNPKYVGMRCVLERDLENALKEFKKDGYEEQDDHDLSPEIAMTEGQEITLKFSGNIKLVGDAEHLRFTFFSHMQRIIKFKITECNRYGNAMSSEYRGMAEFFGEPRIVIEDLEGPEEALQREAEAIKTKKRAKRDGVGQKKEEDKKVKGQDIKEPIVNKSPKNLLCKIPVSLPKPEGIPQRPKSNYRATALDVKGVASNANLKWLSNELGPEWESLASHLGMKNNRIQNIKRNAPDSQEQQIFTMLTTWRSTTKKAHDKDKILCHALSRCGRYDLAEDLKDKEGVKND